MTDVSRRLRESMDQQGITATQLAAELDLTTGRVSQLRKGSPMSQQQIIVICEVLNISPTWLLMGQGPKQLSLVHDHT